MRRISNVLLFCAISLIPWIFFLGIFQGSGTYVIRRWGLAWMGLDVMEVLALVITAALLRRRSIFASPAAAVSSTLFFTDAWFDVVTAKSGGDYAEALLLMCVAEIPLAGLCLAVSVGVTSRFAQLPRADR